MRVALTGTPGVGKTTLAAVMRRNGWRVVDVKEWAKQNGAVVAHDAADAADVIDLEILRILVEPDDGTKVCYEGHLSHFLPVEEAWVVRCDPDVLRERLALRDYTQGKVRENLEVEALDIILQEALEKVPLVRQRDGTRRTPEELFKAFADNRPDAPKRRGAKGRHDIEPVDWSDRLPIG